jgi:glucose/arabinose dehydrogenase
MRRTLAMASLAVFLAVPHAHAIYLQPYLSGLAAPVLVTHAGDGTNRLFVVELAGIIKVVTPGSPVAALFLDVRQRVLDGGERGLLGLAFHPQFAGNQRFYVHYTREPDGASVIAEYRATGSPSVIEATERVLLVVDQPFANHNGGMIAFGPDHMLYIGLGDGGSSNDPGNRAQNVNDLLGKILRIDVDSELPYGIPADNPYAGAATGRDEIYAIGLRNPYRFSFDRITGDLLVADVGQGHREEIDRVTRGANLGWRRFEGTRCTGLDPSCDASGLTPPIAEYDHSGGRDRRVRLPGHTRRPALRDVRVRRFLFGRGLRTDGR